MLKINCPECKKSFFWTDDMPMRDKCPNPDCNWHYSVQEELRKNLNRNVSEEKAKSLLCPFCQEEISSKITICPNCNYIVMGNKAFRKSSAFLVVCLILVILSIFFKYFV